MSNKDINQQKTCAITQKPVDSETAFKFNFNGQDFYFSEPFDRVFKLGLSMGQFEMPQRFLAFLSGVQDNLTKQEIKRYATQFSPIELLDDWESLLNPFQDARFSEDLKIDHSEKYKTPAEVYEELSKTVIGQDVAKRAVSVALINHILNVSKPLTTEVTHSDKNHVLLLGKSGSGKTLLANSAAKIFDLPFATGDALSYSPTGFQGSDTDSVVHDLIVNADLSFDFAETGIIFIDELDKLCSRNNFSHDSFIKMTQSSFLKLVEGKSVKVPATVYGGNLGEFDYINTHNMLFFFGGAFNGLADIIAKKMGKNNASNKIGFIKNTEEENKNKEIDEALKSYEIFSLATEDVMVDSLIEFGVLSELVGRIPTIVPLKPLSKEDLVSVLLKSDVSPLIKYQQTFETSGYQIEFTEEYVNTVADKAYKSAIGTRSLHAIVKSSLSRVMFDLIKLGEASGPMKKIIFDQKLFTDPGNYEVVSVKKSRKKVAS